MISVVIPLYNKAAQIEKAICSVLSQTMPPHELIVVDDGSSDGSGDIAQKYVPSGVKLIRQTNCGVSAARNLGALSSSSSHIAFLDADDVWFNDHLETLQGLICLYPSAVLFSTSHIERVCGRTRRSKSPFTSGWSGEVDDFIRAYSNSYAIVNSSTACVNKKVFMEIGGFPIGVISGEDIIMWLSLSFAGQVVCTGKVTAIYNKTRNSFKLRVQSPELPGSLTYISSLLTVAYLSSKAKSSLESLYFKIAVRTCAGALRSGSLRLWGVLVVESKNTFNWKLLVCLFFLRIFYIWAL